MKIIEELRKLPLEDYPIAKIESLLSQIGKLCFMKTDYPTNMEKNFNGKKIRNKSFEVKQP